MADVWILGGTGRSGRAIAAQLRKRGIRPVPVGRDAARLAAVAEGDRTVVARSAEAMAAEIRRQRPAAVVNTIGPFTRTAPPTIRACLDAGSDYLDLANDLAAVATTLALGDAVAGSGRTVVTGAGFGVTATESVVVKLCDGRTAPEQVRVDMVPSLDTQAGRLGEALAATILEGIPGVEGGGRYQGRRYRNGRLAPAPIGGDVMRLTLPDGEVVTAAGMPLGELLSAQRASGAPNVIAASSEAPSSPVVRVIFPIAAALLAIGPVRDFAIRRLAAVQVAAKPKPREHSWGHAVVRWADGTTREGWLRLGEAQEWTGAVPAEIVRRLLAGEGKAGAFTPAALFGPSLAESCGAEYVV
ncbi:saccharopine dehydrogenase NADP-binding domain-containing protein [Actinoplanes sp. NPDC051343]|uniref:saccharopine dehydrogenase NADP-binding domain-containing protein n=1 Tax=Actinoplanes sp. NPDC051343 TaxID=3363906 RepID=UPI0037A3374C